MLQAKGLDERPEFPVLNGLAPATCAVGGESAALEWSERDEAPAVSDLRRHPIRARHRHQEELNCLRRPGL
jgi:hypothetical protein